jgi:hypothetical protein
VLPCVKKIARVLILSFHSDLWAKVSDARVRTRRWRIVDRRAGHRRWAFDAFGRFGEQNANSKNDSENSGKICEHRVSWMLEGSSRLARGAHSFAFF